MSAGTDLKVLHIITDLKTGGAERMLSRLAEDRDGIEHRVISLRTMGDVGPILAAKGISVQAIGMTGGRGVMRCFTSLVRAIHDAKPDVVQTWLYHADLIGGIAARLAGVRKLAWNIRTADTRPGISLSRTALAALHISARVSSWLPDKVVYVARAAQQSHEKAGYDPDKSVVIHNGYDIPALADRPSRRNQAREALGLDQNAIVIGNAGTFTAQKNQIGFVKACTEVARLDRRARFLLMGRGNSADNAVLKAAIDRTGHAERFLLLGQRNDIDQLMAALDVFCLCSLGEGFPNVVGEAMAVGTACVVTDVGDAALIVGDCGWVVPPADEIALSDALVAAAAKPAAELHALGERAHQRIEQSFSIAVIQRQYAEFYGSLASTSARRAI